MGEGAEGARLTAPATTLAHAITQLVASFAGLHAIRHCPQGVLLPIVSALMADILSAAVPTFMTSSIVQAGGFADATDAGCADAAWTGVGAL
jgi:hypothetical protein